MRFLSRSEQETIEIGRSLARRLSGPRAVLLTGPLGAGKTALARGLAVGLGLSDETLVHSPSFSLINEYPISSAPPVYHVDLYRLDSERDFRSIGIEELLDGEAWVIIEWAEKLRRAPADAVRVRFVVLLDERREITVSGL